VRIYNRQGQRNVTMIGNWQVPMLYIFGVTTSSITFCMISRLVNYFVSGIKILNINVDKNTKHSLMDIISIFLDLSQSAA
jgi:hypothetical protein